MGGGFFRLQLKSQAKERGAALLELFSGDLEATEAMVKERGAAITTEIFSLPGRRRFHSADPAGNEVAVRQNT